MLNEISSLLLIPSWEKETSEEKDTMRGKKLFRKEGKREYIILNVEC